MIYSGRKPTLALVWRSWLCLLTSSALLGAPSQPDEFNVRYDLIITATSQKTWEKSYQDGFKASEGSFQDNFTYTFSADQNLLLVDKHLELQTESSSVSASGNGSTRSISYDPPSPPVELDWRYLPSSKHDPNRSEFDFYNEAGNLEEGFLSPGAPLFIDSEPPMGMGLSAAQGAFLGAFMVGLKAQALFDAPIRLPPNQTSFLLIVNLSTNYADSYERITEGSLREVETWSLNATYHYTATIRGSLAERKLRITSLRTPAKTDNLHSFLATDTIRLTAQLTPPMSGVAVKWTVTGQQAAAGIFGFPSQKERVTDAQGISNFEFKPSDNAALVQNRRTRWTNGTNRPNPPIAFEVRAEAQVEGKQLKSLLSETGLGELEQDETDTLRQEYYDFRATVPERAVVVPSLGPGFNRGNYNVQVSVELKERFDRIRTVYAGSTVTVGGKPVQIPETAGILITSGFRNPQRNVFVGSQFPTSSRHTKGRALDLQPATPVWVLIDGERVRLDLHSQLYPALHSAASTEGSAIAEDGAIPVPVGFCGTGKGALCEDHIHVQW